MSRFVPARTGYLALAALVACGSAREQATPHAPARPGTPVAAIDTILADERDAPGTALPIREATLASRLMSTVRSVRVVEGSHVTAGAILADLDARDLEARRAQLDANLAQMQAGHDEAAAHARRIRALFTDSAATRVQLEQADAALARADAGLAATRAAVTEVDAAASYARIRAPFAGTIVRRYVDPGALAAPGAPLLAIEDAAMLRVTVSATPEEARALRAGRRLAARIADTTVEATIEGVVASGPNQYRLNAVIANAGGRFQSQSPASLRLPLGTRHVTLVPTTAVVQEGDLRAVRTPSAGLRWIIAGHRFGPFTEVLGGLAGGDTVLVPAGGQ